MEQAIISILLLTVVFLFGYINEQKNSTIIRLRKNKDSDMKFFTTEYNRINAHFQELHSSVKAIEGDMTKSFESQNEYIDTCINEIKYKTGLKEKLLIGDVNTPDYAIKQERAVDGYATKDLDTIYERRTCSNDRRQN